jgi:lipoyl(octanoyl) transferase
MTENREEVLQVVFHYVGTLDYMQAWNYQQQLFDNQIAKRENPDSIAGHLIFLEHPHVFTLGKSGHENNLLVDSIQLQAKHASFYHIDRGGDITYHGPGQLVGYPILDLSRFGIGLREYIFKLEAAIIRCIARYGIVGTRLDGATGVWLDVEKPSVRKICAIGVRSSHWVTMHGFALNVNTDLSYFNLINPCGYTDKGVTSLQKELNCEVPMDEVRRFMLEELKTEFGFVCPEEK